jgi:hypothetical protein
MKPHRPISHRRPTGPALVLLALAAGAARVEAQYIPPREIEPKWLDLRLTQSYLKVDAEGEEVNLSGRNSAPTKNQSLYLAPTLGADMQGFVYHPDLLGFNLALEPGYTWQQQGPPGGSTSQSSGYLINGTGNFDLLAAKPYTVSGLFGRSHDIFNYDFFNSQVVDQQSWGIRSGYREGAVPFSISFSQSDQQASGGLQNSDVHQSNVSAHARNERRQGDVTDFTFQFGQYNQTTYDSVSAYTTDSEYSYATLTEAERLGRGDLNATLTMNQYGADGSDSLSLSGNAEYALELTPRLRNSYDYSVNTSTSGGSDYQQHYFRAGLQHQLYESLASSGDLHGAWSDSSSPGSDLQSYATGVSLTENYSKRLGQWGHLGLTAGGGYDRTTQSSSGASLTVQNESHTLNAGQWVPLMQPNIIAIGSVVTSPLLGSRPLTENVDYYVNRAANPWLISLDPASIIITSGAGVVVTYEVQPNPSGDFSTRSEQFQVRLDLLDNRLGLYTRYSTTDNQASSPAFVLDNYAELAAGADLQWWRLQFDATYTDRHSSLIDYLSYTTAESWRVTSTARHSASINLSQQWSSYPGNGTNAAQAGHFYSYTARYDYHPGDRFKWNVEAGLEAQNGFGVAETFLVLRSNLGWHVGKLELNLGYDYQHQEYTAETRERNFLSLRMKRTF